MTQRLKQSGINLSNIDSEIYPSNYSKRERQNAIKPQTPVCHHKCKEKLGRSEHTNSHLIKGASSMKQQNMPSPNSPVDVIQYSAFEESPLVEVTVKHTNAPKPRSKSTVSAREPWGQLLKKHKGGKESVFSNFDPLRTLHFLAKELQIHLQALLPGDRSIQEIITAMQDALKRVPPEVASTVHLQQAIGLLPSVRKSSSLHTFEDNIPTRLTSDKCIQTHPMYEKEEAERIHRVMEENTIKLEASCLHLEAIGTQLKNDKIFLETQLQNERANVEFFKKRIEDLEELNRDLSQKLSKRDDEIRNLQSEVIDNRSSKTDGKAIITDLKQSKSGLEQEVLKLKHQLRLCAIEKEKYIAVLAVRDRQINEIRNEMTQLQEVVNDQLVELNSNALAAMPCSSTNPDAWRRGCNDNGDDGAISSIHDLEDADNKKKSNENLNGFQSGDSDLLSNFQNDHAKAARDENFIYESQTVTNIKDMFAEVKNQAYALAEGIHDS